MEEITKDNLKETINDLLEEEDLTYEEEQLLLAILFIIENVELNNDIIGKIFDIIDKTFMDDDINENFNGLMSEISKRIRRGEMKRTFKKGFVRRKRKKIDTKKYMRK